MGIRTFLTTTVEVQQSSQTRNAMGGTTQAFSTRIASLRCRLRPLRQTEPDLNGKMTPLGMWRLYCEANSDGTSIEETDRIVWTRGGTSKTLQVKTIYNAGQLDRHMQIDLLEVL